MAKAERSSKVIPRDPAPADPVAAPATPADEITRFSIPLRGDGSVDLDTMHARRIDQLKKIAHDPRLRDSTGPAAVMIDAAVIGTFYDALALVQVTIAERMYPQLTHDAVAARLAYTESEKAALAPPTIAVLNKYLGSALEKYGDELALVALVGMTGIGKFRAVASDAAHARHAPPPIRHVPQGMRTDESQEGKL